MTRREEQRCFADGKLAFRERVGMDACPRRGALQRAAWRRGYEEEARRGAAERATPEQLTESAAVIERLKQMVEGL